MTRQHFIAIAHTLRGQFEAAHERFFNGGACDPGHLIVKQTALDLADYFASINPAFDRHRFMVAAVGEEYA